MRSIFACVLAVTFATDLMPMLFRVGVGQTKTLSLDLKCSSYATSGPPVIRIARIATHGDRTDVVIEGLAAGTTVVALTCGRAQQQVTVEVR